MGWLEYDPRSSRLTKDVTELSRAVAQLPGPPTGGGFLVLPTKFGTGNEGRENETKCMKTPFKLGEIRFCLFGLRGRRWFCIFLFFVYENPRPSNVNEMYLKTTRIYGGFVGTHLQNSTFAETSTYRFDHAFCEHQPFLTVRI